MGSRTLDAQMLEVRYNGWPQRDRPNLGCRLREARERLWRPGEIQLFHFRGNDRANILKSGMSYPVRSRQSNKHQSWATAKRLTTSAEGSLSRTRSRSLPLPL